MIYPERTGLKNKCYFLAKRGIPSFIQCQPRNKDLY